MKCLYCNKPVDEGDEFCSEKCGDLYYNREQRIERGEAYTKEEYKIIHNFYKNVK
jgi:predicted nucleic acid-binding Zn ribbon protein